MERDDDRRQNLERITQQFPTVRACARAIGHANSGWLVSVLAGRRPIGDSAARGLEVKLGLAPGALDERPGQSDVAVSPFVLLQGVSPTIHRALESFAAAVAADIGSKVAR